MLCWRRAFIPIEHSTGFLRDVHSLKEMLRSGLRAGQEMRAGITGQVTSGLGSGVERR